MEIEDGVEQNLKFLKDHIHGVPMLVEHLTILLMPNIVEGYSQSYPLYSQVEALSKFKAPESTRKRGHPPVNTQSRSDPGP